MEDRKKIMCQLERWEARREIQNLVGKYANYIIMKREDECVKDLWADREDICLGLNNGYYCGKDVGAFYRGVHAETKRKSQLMAQLYPEQLREKSDEALYGVGQVEYKPFSTAVIEIAQDMQTAKGFWYCQGIRDDLTVSGPLTFWTFGVYAIDFLRQDDTWKIWHMLYLEDINNPCGTSWCRRQEQLPTYIAIEMAAKVGLAGDRRKIPLVEIPLLSCLKESLRPTPTVITVNRELYHCHRPYQRTPQLPEPYDTFENTFSYGLEGRGLVIS